MDGTLLNINITNIPVEPSDKLEHTINLYSNNIYLVTKPVLEQCDQVSSSNHLH